MSNENRVNVKVIGLKHRGGRFTGQPSGAIYVSHPSSGQLHLTKGAVMSTKPGILPEDVAEFQQFPGIFQIEGAPKAPPPPVKVVPPPKPPDEFTPGGDGDGEPDPSMSPPTPSGVSASQKPQYPPDNAVKRMWIEWAIEHNVELDALEKESLSKPELIKTIRERFELQAGD